MRRILCRSLLPGLAVAFVATQSVAQVPRRPGAPPPAAAGSPPVVPPGGAPGAAAGGTAAPGAGTIKGGKGDTGTLPQFEQGVDFEPKNPDYKVAFSLEDADLPEIVRVIGQLTG
jgi:general secretion pathway protein D